MSNQLMLFNVPKNEYKIDKKIRLMEYFAGMGTQAQALRRIGADFEHYFVCEFDKSAVAAYNAVHGTNFPVSDIRNIHAADVPITEKDKYCYMLTYSFPCTDLSIAGKQEGMKKGSGTRSGLLWEVERILLEYKKIGSLPDVLIMENVTQVHGKKNIEDFRNWINMLEGLGYSNHYKDLDSKEYGVAQHRERCFMVSILGAYDYEFPKPIKLEKVIEDYLEDEVDEKYFLKSEKAQKLIDQLIMEGKIPE